MGKFKQTKRVVYGKGGIIIFIRDERTLFIKDKGYWFCALRFRGEQRSYYRESWHPFKHWLTRPDSDKTSVKIWRRADECGVDLHYTAYGPSEKELEEANGKS